MKDISTTEVCPRDDIGAYLDGELSQGYAGELEDHVRECAVCSRSMREQRQILAALSASLGSEAELELPADFTRKVVVQAESSVSGVRRPAELVTAVCISVALLIFAVFAFGGDTFPIASAAAGVVDKLFAFVTFAARTFLNVAFAIAVVVRGLASQLSAGGAAALALAPGAAFLLLFSSRRLLRRSDA